MAQRHQIHAYFNNDAFANAVKNAQELKALIGEQKEGDVLSSKDVHPKAIADNLNP